MTEEDLRISIDHARKRRNKKGKRARLQTEMMIEASEGFERSVEGDIG